MLSDEAGALVKAGPHNATVTIRACWMLSSCRWALSRAHTRPTVPLWDSFPSNSLWRRGRELVPPPMPGRFVTGRGHSCVAVPRDQAGPEPLPARLARLNRLLHQLTDGLPGYKGKWTASRGLSPTCSVYIGRLASEGRNLKLSLLCSGASSAHGDSPHGGPGNFIPHGRILTAPCYRLRQIAGQWLQILGSPDAELALDGILSPEM